LLNINRRRNELKIRITPVVIACAQIHILRKTDMTFQGNRGGVDISKIEIKNLLYNTKRFLGSLNI
jgi:hypothetical protein